jgi:two-component system, chemotaxis family, chemotaxis protein CheY
MSRDPKRILITDGTFLMRTALKNILTQHGYEVVGEATTPSECLEMCRRLKPDLVTLDVAAGGTPDGLTALRELRNLGSGVKVVVCSAQGEKDLVIEAIKAGARDFIVKPFEPSRVLEAVDRLLAA